MSNKLIAFDGGPSRTVDLGNIGRQKLGQRHPFRYCDHDPGLGSPSMQMIDGQGLLIFRAEIERASKCCLCDVEVRHVDF